MKRQTSILHILTKRCFQKNKGRNLAAILAIFLTAMMFAALFTMAQSLEQNITEMYLRQAGTTAHASSKQVTDIQIKKIAEHPDVVNYGSSIVVGIAENQQLAGRQLEIRYADSQYAKYSFAYPSKGKLPEKQNEIALDTLTAERLGIPLELGQPVTLEWKKEPNSPEAVSSHFELCGWWEGNLSSYADMAWVSEAFALDACAGAPAPSLDEGRILGLRMMGVSFSRHKNIEAKIAKVLSETGVEQVEFSPNLTYTPEMQYSIFMENMPMYGGMVLVFLAGYLIIFNVFQISVASDIQFYGRLKTLGMTKKQLKKLVFGQGNRLSFIGIPIGLIAGWILGAVLVPSLVTVKGMDTMASASPWIFIGSALFSYITVTASCMLPARMAGKVSPIEALRYTDADPNLKKKTKKSKNGASLLGMAWANLWRSRKRTIMIICSLTLGFVLMSYFYAENASFDMEKYLLDFAVADYQLDDATNNLSDGYRPESQTISDTLLSDIAALGSVEETGRLYTHQTKVDVSEQARDNLKAFYHEERLKDFAANDPSFPNWKAEFDRVIAGQENEYTVYGADMLVLEAAASSNYILDGAFDQEKFASGNYALAIGPSTSPRSGLPTWAVGEKVEIAGREFEIMAVTSPFQPMVKGSGPVFDLPLVIPADVFLELWPESHLRKFFFNVSDDAMEDAYSLLSEYQQGGSMGMNIVSRQTIAEQYEAQRRSSAVTGYAISITIALVGVLNFVNSMATAVISRKREFAMIQSIGMTKRQLRRMLDFEGLFYAGLTLAASYFLGSVVVGVVVRGMVEGGFTTFHFTLLPLVCCTPVLLLLAVLVPFLCFKNLEKQSVVERLRAV